MNIIWYTMLIRAIPEAIGETLVTLAVVKEKRSLKEILLVSVFCGLTAFLLRILPLKFGISTLVAIVVQVFIMNYIFRIKIHKLFRGVLVCLMLLVVSEILTVAFIQYILNEDPQIIYSTGLGTLLAGIPSLITLYLGAFIIFKVNNSKVISINREVINDVDK